MGGRFQENRSQIFGQAELKLEKEGREMKGGRMTKKGETTLKGTIEQGKKKKRSQRRTNRK